MILLLNKYFKQVRGSVAVEFSFIAMPFIMLFVGIIEVGLFFGTAVMLEGAAGDASRMIRTGQVQTSGDPVGTFSDKLCEQANLFVDCGALQYEVIPVPDGNFASVAAMTPTFDVNGDLISAGFDPGGSEDVIIIRVVYKYTFLTPLMGRLMESTANTNQSRLMSTVVIKNEPFEVGAG